MSGTQTPLYEFHEQFNPVWVDFAGYSMPVRFKPGIIAEHRHTRESAGLFDVSHMGQVVVTSKGGGLDGVALALERLIPANIAELPQGRQRYGLFTSMSGGILDDLMISHMPGRLLLVVNASRKREDIRHLRMALGEAFDVDLVDNRALIAIQGPKSEAALKKLIPGVTAMRFMDVAEFAFGGETAWISRSGYTGEDGFEISIPARMAIELCHALVCMDEVMPVGLGARDSLRLEAGLCLYGADIDETTSPAEADLVWAIQKVRRPGGSREGGYLGSDRINREMACGANRIRVGLRPEGRAPMRGGTPLFRDAQGSERVGEITSGGFGPTVNGPVSMGYVGTSCARVGTQLFGEVRGKFVPVRVAALPFVPMNFRR